MPDDYTRFNLLNRLRNSHEANVSGDAEAIQKQRDVGE